MRSQKLWIAVCISIFLIGAVWSMWQILRPHSETVQIVQNGKVLYTIDLSTAEDRSIDIEYQGHHNIVKIENHHIYIESADCPDQTCVKMGELESGAAPIVCLPNKLVIEFTEKNYIDAEVR